MDPSLIREQQAFKRKAMSQPTVEKRKQPANRQIDREYSPESDSRKQRAPPPSKKSGEGSGGAVRANFDYKNVSSQATAVKFNILKKIISYMRERHLKGYDYGLTVDEILDETKQDGNVGPRIRVWLATEALPNNPKLRVDGGKFLFKPIYKITDHKGLLSLLEKQHVNGAGGILMEDIEDSLPNAAKAFEELKSSIIILKRPDKKQVVFLKDPSVAVDMPEEIVKLWRSVSVEGMDAKKIADHLDKSGFSFIKNDLKPPVAKKRGGKRGARSGGKFIPKHNDHVKELLQDYSKMAK